MKELLPPLSWKESMSQFRLSPENPDLGPSTITCGNDEDILPKSDLSQDKRMLGPCSLAFHQGEKDTTLGAKGEKGETVGKTHGDQKRSSHHMHRSTGSCTLFTV